MGLFSRNREGARLPTLTRDPTNSENAAIIIDVRTKQPTLKEVIELAQKGFPNHRLDELYFVRAKKGEIIIVADMNIPPNRT